ncbi:hypothetical protein [Nocardioides donggukensis]|uniref:Uncharacterized protein n=1 Tax=Nocardioides donggukensis TaxID=2774019 RepID=A0A927K7X5_9ACTN|nr:hypothetical protein [Nocardioides donggukensis]MBD8869305.1 hypothetical protein [Nocardioides donggukensis]
MYTFSRYVVMPQRPATDAAVIDEILPDEDWLDVEKELGDRGSTPGVPIGSLPSTPPRSEEDFAEGIREGFAEAYHGLLPELIIWGDDPSPRARETLPSSEFTRRVWDAIGASSLGNWLRETRMAVVPNTGNFDVGAFRVLVPEMRSRLAAAVETDTASRARADLRPFMSAWRWERESDTFIARINQAWAGLLWPPADPSSETYAFAPTPPHTVNLGIQLIYEQSWVPLGHQPGETVRTVTLGPRQSERVVIRRESRSTRSTTSEVSTEVQTTTESSSSARDSTEVVEESSSQLGWHAEATASASFGFGSASVTAGAAGEDAQSSKESKAHLNETMQQSSSRLRRTVTVSKAVKEEQSTEKATISEISNPNDGMAVTYLYSRLQKRYEISTRLSQVRLCAFIAEALPLPHEIDADWIRRFDWILARVLLDDAYAQDLDRVRADAPDVGTRDENVTNLMGSIVAGGMTLPDLPAAGAPPDVFAIPQEVYEREVQRERAAADAARSVERAVHRLRRHIIDNVLHYWRAIAVAEDPDARYLRFQQIRVPVDWTCSITASGRVEVCEPGTRTAPIAEVIAPNGPIGFAGNSAVYPLSGDGRFNELEAAAGQLRMPYLVHHASASRIGAGDAPITSVTIGIGVVGPRRDRITWIVDDAAFAIDVWVPEAELFDRRGSAPLDDLNTVLVNGMRVTFDPAFEPATGDTFEIVVEVLPSLEDPEIRQIRESLPRANPDEAAFYSPDTLARHAALFPELRGALTDGATWASLVEVDRERVRARRAEFVLHERHTRRITLDSDDLMLSLLVDHSQSLEPFKAAHRFVDVLSASADTESKRIENARRQARLDANQLGDPDIDRVTVVQPGVIGGLVNHDDDADPP